MDYRTTYEACRHGSVCMNSRVTQTGESAWTRECVWIRAGEESVYG